MIIMTNINYVLLRYGLRKALEGLTFRVGAHEFRQPGHENGHPFGGGDDLVVLGRPLPHRFVQVMRSHLCFNDVIGNWAKILFFA